MGHNKKTIKERLAKLNIELKEREDALQDKIDSEIAYYGKPLGHYAKYLRKIEVTKRKIARVENSVKNIWHRDRDMDILDNIKHNKDGGKHTSVEKYRFNVDNRFNGSYKSRKNAKLMDKKQEKD
jgi:hypothetical protein|tara:strand:+ start:209 stop:583 length:375 start_codon:yes stop_codon:yes gene_type:complete